MSRPSGYIRRSMKTADLQIRERDGEAGPDRADGTASASGVRPSRSPLRALLVACRPRQWVKNVLVFAAPAAAGVLGDPDVPGELALTFVSFCMLSSATYLLNDVHDRHEDRGHPRRRHRPIASGEVSVRLALSAAIALAVCG